MGVAVSNENSSNLPQQQQQQQRTVIQVMPSANELPRKEGELLKYKNIFTGWGKRYFRLDRSYLHYFETKYTHAPLATITRSEISDVKLSTQFPEKENVFEVVHKGGLVWYCQATSPGELVSWMQALSPVPFVLDASKYPMVSQPPPEQSQEFEFVAVPPYNPPPTVPSPYSNLMDDAHQTAYINQTPHDHCHHGPPTVHHHSPPPPYSAGGQRPPLNNVPPYDANHN